MKPTLFILITVVCSNSLTAQSEVPRRLMFKMSPQHLAVNTLKAGVEIFPKEKSNSFILLLSATSNNGLKDVYPLFPYEGFGLEIAHRKYIAPIQEMTNRIGRPFTQGIYFSVFLQGGAYQADYDFIITQRDFNTQTYIDERIQYAQSAQSIATGFTIGLQRVFWKIITVDVSLGAGYQVAFDKITKGTLPENLFGRNGSGSLDNAAYTGVIPKGGIMIGLFLQ